MELFYVLLVLLITARMFAEAAVRLGQPELLGEILAGISLGLIIHAQGDAFPVLSELDSNEVFTAIKDLGIFFLMLLGGIELQPREMAKASTGGAMIGLGGVVLPFMLGVAFGHYLLPPSEYKSAQIVFLATALSVTAVPVAIKVLLDMGKLTSKAGKMIVSGAVIDDVVSLVLLAVLTAVIQTGALPSGADIGVLALHVIFFFAITSVIGHFVFPKLGTLLQKTRADEIELSMLLTAAFAYALLAEALGMHFILGAFQAGLFFRRRTIDSKTFHNIQDKIKGVTNGFLAPVFFVSVGLHLDISALSVIPGIVVGLIVVASIGKVVGAGLAARLWGFDRYTSAAIGIAMNARGAVELIIADIALRAGVFAHPSPPPPIIEHLFSAVVIMAIVTTVATPPLLRLAFKMAANQKRESTTKTTH